MTRKEIEKRCREAMEQNLPDKDALWMRIESRLPEQSAPPAEEKPKRKISVIYRTVAAAACLLFVAGGVMLVSMHRIPHMETANKAAPSLNGNQDFAGEMADEAKQEAAMEELAPATPKSDQFVSDVQEAAPAQADLAPEHEAGNVEGVRSPEEAEEEILRYTSLQVPQTADVAANTDRSKLRVTDTAFDETAVLKATTLLVRAEVLSGTQDSGTGIMHYTLALRDCYNTGEQPDAEFTLENSSPYLLEAGHVYLLPLARTEDGWSLSFADAPQIEVTLDGRMLCHSGWQSLLQNGCTPVQCEPQTEDDAFYDKMYLTNDTNPDALIYVWASIK
ncbi:MAG: hypothetical protein IKN55_09855 [Oscillospiraceae bacterium]|nr:hypothetical protein [Oscillospiraceae bacterium]